MGLMDKVKAQATGLAREGKAKYDQVQATRRADALLRNLGALVYAENTGRGAGDTQAQIDSLIADLKAHEAANGINLSAEPTDQPQGGAGGASQPPAGPAGTGQPQAGPASGFPPQAGTSFPPEAGTTTQV
jgi:hypothetical protein